MTTATEEVPDWRHYDPLPTDRVLAAAVDVFVEVGYHGATVRQIARRCGLSVPGMYHYQLTKQGMLAKVLDITMEDLLWRSDAARAEAGTDPVRRFAFLVECLALYHTYRRDLAFIGASEMRSLEEEHRRRITGARVTQQRMVDAEVDAAVAAGRFTTPTPHEASRAVVTMCTAIVQWYREDGPFTPEAIARQYVEFAFGVMHHRNISGMRSPRSPRRAGQ